MNFLTKIKMRCLPPSSRSFHIAMNEQKKQVKELADSLNELTDLVLTEKELTKDRISAELQRTIKNNMRTKCESYYQKTSKSGLIQQEALKNCQVFTNRKLALDIVPKDCIAAEVGVAFGEFSDEILAHVKPKKFYAIDHFNINNPFWAFNGKEYCRRDNMPHQQWYEHKYRDEISSGRMIVRQGFSWDVLARFEDDFFDFLYLDAAHDYNSVMKDIAVCKNKIKNGGIIQFNDYVAFAPEEDAFYGTVPAINSFLNSGRHEVIGFAFAQNGFSDLLVRVVKE